MSPEVNSEIIIREIVANDSRAASIFKKQVLIFAVAEIKTLP